MEKAFGCIVIIVLLGLVGYVLYTLSEVVLQFLDKYGWVIETIIGIGFFIFIISLLSKR